jgi:hypothetical protein
MQPYQVRIRRPSWIEPSQNRPFGWAKPIAMTIEYFQGQPFEFVVAGRTVLRGNCHTEHLSPILDMQQKLDNSHLTQTGRILRIARTRKFLPSCCHVRVRALSHAGTHEKPYDKRQQTNDARYDRRGNSCYLQRSEIRTASLGFCRDRWVGRVPDSVHCLKLCLGVQYRLCRSEGNPP